VQTSRAAVVDEADERDDSAATGAWLMSWFHQLSAGKIGGSGPPTVVGDDCAARLTASRHEGEGEKADGALRIISALRKSLAARWTGTGCLFHWRIRARPLSRARDGPPN
jgi:hypothetical protein